MVALLKAGDNAAVLELPFFVRKITRFDRLAMDEATETVLDGTATLSLVAPVLLKTILPEYVLTPSDAFSLM